MLAAQLEGEEEGVNLRRDGGSDNYGRIAACSFVLASREEDASVFKRFRGSDLGKFCGMLTHTDSAVEFGLGFQAPILRPTQTVETTHEF
jgi:hypothetical protein